MNIFEKDWRDTRYDDFTRRGKGCRMIVNDEMDVLLEEGGGNHMYLKRKRYFLITTFIIVAVVAVILCVGFFAQNKANEFDGTLVYNSEIGDIYG